ncbi:F-box/LRR-repeat protein At3g03360-like [Triticum urartu]|nr:F-box/LRR-repeat protein At3g03360-like [Triticum urartu]
MEIESNPKYCRVIRRASSEDRLSSLPDDVLHSIVGRVPLKQAVRTNALSTRWACLWLHALAASAVLDFTDCCFVRGQSPGQIVATLNRCLVVHGAAPIDVFRVALSPFNAFRRDVVRWAAAALGRGAREVGVDLTQHADGRGALELPGDLFQAKSSLAVLSLSRCSLRHVPPGAAGLAGLTWLSLNQVDVTDDVVGDVVSECRLLEFLSLKSCHLLVSVRVAGERLRGLEIVCCLAMHHLQVAAPMLESVAYHGDVLIWREDEPSGLEFVGLGGSGVRSDARPELKDVHLSHIGYGEYDQEIHEFAYSGFMEQVAHAKILTLCSVGFLHMEEARSLAMGGVDTPNLEELQLLLDSMGDDDVTRFSGFFELIAAPLLERLFIRISFLIHNQFEPEFPWRARPPLTSWNLQLPDTCGGTAATGEDADILLDYEIALDHLMFLKVVNFRGTRRELRLLRFVLRRAPVLEQLVLITPEDVGTPGDHEQQESVRLLLKVVQEHVSEISKAWLWQEPRVTVCRPREDDSRSPAHTKYYHHDRA